MTTKTQTRSPALDQISLRVLVGTVDFDKASKMAKRMGTAIPTLSEFIRILYSDYRLYDKLKGDWYWLGDGPNSLPAGPYKIEHFKGSIRPVSEKTYQRLLVEDRAYVYRGAGAMVLGIGIFPHRSLSISQSDNRTVASVAFIDTTEMLVQARAALARLKRESLE